MAIRMAFGLNYKKKGKTMNELQSIYETYLEVAWRFAQKGNIKNAKKTLKTLKKVLKNEKKAKNVN